MQIYLAVLIVIAIILILPFWMDRRQRKRLHAENEIRARLELPPLTRDQFSITVVEKSAEFRANINQHM